MNASLMAFATDFVDEGVPVALDRMKSVSGISDVTMAVAYHHGRDIFPHNPRRKVLFLEGGVVFFKPKSQLYRSTPIKPITSELAKDRDPFAELINGAQDRDLGVQAWAVYLHNTQVGSAHPDLVARNAFGDPYLTNLCPANPAVVEYATALTSDISRYGPTRILGESLHHHPLEHGYHHERYLITLGPTTRFLFGICFCDHCLALATSNGIDGRGIQAFVRQHLERSLSGNHTEDTSPLEFGQVGQLANGELGGYLKSRSIAVSELVNRAQDASGPSRLAFIDPSGAAKGYSDGKPSGGPAAEVAWTFGVDIEAISLLTEFQTIGYAVNPARFQLDLSAYRDRLGPSAALATIIRPMPPDCDADDNLAEKLGAAVSAGVTAVDFYHYGLMQLSTLERIGRAFERVNP
jgi:hypothetical protein